MTLSWGSTSQPGDEDLGYVDTLAALHALLGKPVTVTVADADGDPAFVATMHGVLTRAGEAAAGRLGAGEARSFTVLDGRAPDPIACNGFALHPACFAGGRRDADRRVRFREGGVVVLVALGET